MEQLRPVAETTNNPIIQNGNPVEMNVAQNTASQPIIRTVDINNLAPENKGFSYDLFEGDLDPKFAKAKTPDAKPDVDISGVKYINPQPTPTGTGSHISPNGTILKSKEDFRSGVKAFMMVVDYAISFIAMKLADDTRRDAYTADSQQKKLVEDVLVEYLYGKQTQMPMWLTLTFAIGGSYGLILFTAGQKRYKINQLKKSSSTNNKDRYGAKGVEGPPGFANQPTQSENNKSHIPDSDMKRYQDINPPVKPPIVRPRVETTYTQDRDGTLKPTEVKTYSEIINEPSKQSSPQDPDSSITAESSAKLREMVDRGIYPMYKRNAKGGINKVKYTSGGQPIMAGKPGKLIKRRS